MRTHRSRQDAHTVSEVADSIGCSGYLTQPIDAEVLLRTLADSLATRVATGSDTPHETTAKAEPSTPDSETPGPVGPASASSPSPGSPLVSTLPTEDPDFREIVEEFVEYLPGHLREIEAALNTDDFPRVTRLAHELKETAGTAGFSAFTGPASHLESLAKESQFDDIEAVVEDLLVLSERVVVAPVS